MALLTASKTSNLLFSAALQLQFLIGEVRADFQELKNQIQHWVSDPIKKDGAISEVNLAPLVLFLQPAYQRLEVFHHRARADVFAGGNRFSG